MQHLGGLNMQTTSLPINLRSCSNAQESPGYNWFIFTFKFHRAFLAFPRHHKTVKCYCAVSQSHSSYFLSPFVSRLSLAEVQLFLFFFFFIIALKGKRVKRHERPPSRQSNAALCLNPSSVTVWQFLLTFLQQHCTLRTGQIWYNVRKPKKRASYFCWMYSKGSVLTANSIS